MQPDVVLVQLGRGGQRALVIMQQPRRMTLAGIGKGPGRDLLDKQTARRRYRSAVASDRVDIALDMYAVAAAYFDFDMIISFVNIYCLPLTKSNMYSIMYMR